MRAIIVVCAAVTVVAGAAATPWPSEGQPLPNAPAVASDFAVVGHGSTWPRCATKRIAERLTAMLAAFNDGRGKDFGAFFSASGNLQSYTTNGFAGFGGRRAIAAHVFRRWLLGDGWTGTRLQVPSGISGDQDAFFLGLRLSAHGIVTRELAAKIVVDCDSGLIRQWVGPSFAP